MGWNFPWSESIKKRISKYFLQRYLGSFLREKLTLDQLSVDIYNGTGTVQDLQLDAEKINGMLERLGAPLEVVDGYVRRVTVSVPWSALLARSSSLEVEGLQLTLKPNLKRSTGGDMDVSRLSRSMTSSLQLAQECLSGTGLESPVPLVPPGSSVDEGALPEGLEAFARTIDFVLAHIRLTFVDTIARLEHMLLDTNNGVALEARISRVEYFDDAVPEDSSLGATSSPGGQARAAASSFAAAAAFTTKNVHFTGVTLHTDEFRPGTQLDLSAPMSENLGFNPLSSVKSKSIYHSTESMPQYPGGDGQMPLSSPVQFAAMLGEQRVKLRLKLNEQLPGPALASEICLSSLGVFVCPRQVHLLTALLNQFSPDSSSDSISDSPECENWTEAQPSVFHLAPHAMDPFGHHDAGDVTSQMMHSVNFQDDELDYSYRHQPLLLRLDHHSVESQMFSSARMDNVDSESTSSAWGSQSSDTGSVSSSHRATAAEGSASPLPHSTVMMELAFVLAVLIHDNPARPTNALDDIASGDCADELEAASKRFFSGFAGQRTKGVSKLHVIRDETVDYCPADHLKLIAKAFKLETKQQNATGGIALTNMTVAVGNCELTEWADSRPRIKGCDARPYHSEILVFASRDNVFGNLGDMTQSVYDTSAGSSACIKVSVITRVQQKQKQRARRRRGDRQFNAGAAPQTAVTVQLLRTFHADLDISLYDRLYNLRTPPQALKQRRASEQLHEAYGGQNSVITIILNSDFDGDVIIRVPIADLRGCHGEPNAAQRLPWQWRHLRSEALRLHISQPGIQAVLPVSASRATDCASEELLSSVEISCDSLTCSILVSEGAEEHEVLCARRAYSDSPLVNREQENKPNITVSWRPERKAAILFPLLSPGTKTPVGSCSNGSSMDSLSNVIQFETPPLSPFSEQRTLCNDAEQAVTPGTKAELKRFVDAFSTSAPFRVYIRVPHVDVLLGDHATLELLYNRLCNDLLMWEPLSPLQPEDHAAANCAYRGWAAARNAAQTLAANVWIHPAAAMMPDGSSINDSSCVGGSSLADTGGTVLTLRVLSSRSDQADPASAKCKVAVRLSIARASVLIRHADAADYTESEVCGLSSSAASVSLKMAGRPNEYSAGGYGRWQELPVTLIDIADCIIFVASEAGDDPNHQLCSIQVHRCALYYTSAFPSVSWPNINSVDEFSKTVRELSQPSLYSRDDQDAPSDISMGVGAANEDMLAVAMQIKLNPVRKMKDMVVALRVSSAAVAPCFADPVPLLKLQEFFELVDDEILGYTFPKVVIELHAHAVSCAADIRLPTSEHRALLFAKKIDVTSNVVANSSVNAVSLVVEDAALYLAKLEQLRRSSSADAGPSSSESAHPDDVPRGQIISDDVCVMDLGHLSLLSRTSDGHDLRYPKVDLTAECNIIHVRTCYDSLKALVNLVQQLVDHAMTAPNGSNLDTPVPSMSASDMSSSSQTTVFDCSSTDSAVKFSDESKQQVSLLMAEAMGELSLESASADQSSLAASRRAPQCAGPHAQAQAVPGSGESTLPGCRDSDATRSLPGTTNVESDGFLIVEGFPIIDEPLVQFLNCSQETLRCRDYFERPLGHADQLNAPCGLYPAEVECRYTLNNLSLVWHLYGGEDFGGVGLSRHQGPAVSMGEAARQARGGKGRDHDSLLEIQLSKLRAQREEYCPALASCSPSSAAQRPSSGTRLSPGQSPTYVSRTCLLMGDIEVRDRLRTSCIDKLLYMHSSDNMPKQTNANAVLVKVVCFMADPSESSNEECNIRVSLQPLRLNLDQDALVFIHSFFTKALSSLLPSGGQSACRPEQRPLPAGINIEPKASVPATAALHASEQGLATEQASLRHVVFDEIDAETNLPLLTRTSSGIINYQGKARQLFIKSFEFTPGLCLRLDYVGKGFSAGTAAATDGGDQALPPLVRLIAGLTHLNRVELRLKELRFKHGILGAERLLQECLKVWQPDLQKQFPLVLSGVGPASSLVQIYSGLRDLLWLPIEQYKKDGRIMFGLRRGANAFGVSTAAAFLELSYTAAQALQAGAQLASDLLSPLPSSHSRMAKQQRKKRAPPVDVRQGLVNAVQIVSEGMCETSNRIVEVATAEGAERGLRGTVGGMLRQIPPVAMQPLIVAARGASEIIQAARNQLVPDALKEECNKWRHHGSSDHE